MTAENRAQVERVCSEALGREPSARAAFLADVCAGDDDLRREVESLLAQEAGADGFLEASLSIRNLLAPPATILPGRRIGNYEIHSLLGTGGTGEVYRARDTRLHRHVALKVLSPRLGGSTSLARFAKEAQILAGLNHPNIAAIYGIEEVEGFHALVLELVAGETLATRLERNALPTSEAIQIARQIASALEAAHGQGLIHRDLKPSNVAVRPDGTVKVLDFGIAKALTATAMDTVAALTPSVTGTQPGSVLGTAAYMSPEQARGQAVDRRTDIWAFGCVLYEMLTGRAAFQKASVSDTLAAVLTTEPDWGLVRSETPESVRRLLKRCLQKDRNSRLRDIGDAALDLEDSLSQRDVPVAEKQAITLRGRREIVAWGVAALCLALLAAGAVYVRQAREPDRVVRFQVSVPGTQAGFNSGDAVSPDGTRLAFVALGPTGDHVLWVRELDRLDVTPLPGTEGAHSPFWSPDSESIAFFAQEKLKRTAASGGAIQTLCEVLAPAIAPAGSWGANGTIIFAQAFGPLHKVSAQGGESTPVTRLSEERQEFGHYTPVFFPDGDHFAYEVGAMPERLGIRVGSLTSANTTTLLPRSYLPFTVTASGFLLYVDQELLRAQRLDLSRLQTVGENLVVANGVASQSDGLASLSASSNGTIAYRSSSSPMTQLTWFDRSGKQRGTVGPPGKYAAPALSPDETKVAVARDGDIWVLDAVRGQESRLTFEASPEFFPLWSPDGKEILYSSGIYGALVRKASSGTGEEEVLLDEGGAIPSGWSPDGRYITYAAAGPGTFLDLWVLPLFGERKPQRYLQTKFQEVDGKLSPDGRRMTYASLLSGRSEVYVETFPATHERWQVSTGGGAQPFWRGDGKELYYADPQRRLMAVDIAEAPSFAVGIPRPLFQMTFPPGRNGYVPSRDGQRFLVNTFVERAGSDIVVVLNWMAGFN
jgi:Tol biopolymer transport system component/tRNA A-37 threonylcarbamoyl transferase component Bud32